MPYSGDCRKFWGVRAMRAFFRPAFDLGESVVWILRLVKIGTEGEGQSRDVMKIERPDDLADIADLGLTLSETKRLLAALQQEIVAAQAGDHAARRPACSRCGGGCRVKDYQDHVGGHAFRPGGDTASALSLCGMLRERVWYRLAIALPVDTRTGSAIGASRRLHDI